MVVAAVTSRVLTNSAATQVETVRTSSAVMIFLLSKPADIDRETALAARAGVGPGGSTTYPGASTSARAGRRNRRSAR